MATNTEISDLPSEVPVFLKKTYHMIDTCAPEIASWTDHGSTFTIKDPTAFERTVIPTYFKHSKFSSFVRQLNFYAFRKIKYSDSIRIDVEAEKKTINYWRFRHDNFRKGRPDLLTQIKRMNGKNTADSKKVASKESQSTKAEDSDEVIMLKKRIEEMSKNMDALTEMVKNVSLAQQAQPEVGNKRAKPDVAIPDMTLSQPDTTLSQPDVPVSALPVISNMEIEELAAMPLDNEESDNAFVDQLFAAFEDEDIDEARPDPALMQRLSDTLALLPKEMQQLICNRLIDAITHDLVSDAAPKTSESKKKLPKSIPVIPVHA